MQIIIVLCVISPYTIPYIPYVSYQELYLINNKLFSEKVIALGNHYHPSVKLLLLSGTFFFFSFTYLVKKKENEKKTNNKLINLLGQI